MGNSLHFTPKPPRRSAGDFFQMMTQNTRVLDGPPTRPGLRDEIAAAWRQVDAARRGQVVKFSKRAGD